MNCTDSLIIMVLSLSAKPIFPALRSTLQAFKTQYVISQLVRNIQAGVKTFWRQEDTCCLNVWQWRQSLYHTYYAYTHHILFVTSLPYNFSHPALWENCALAGTKKKSLRWRKFDFHDIKLPTRCAFMMRFSDSHVSDMDHNHLDLWHRGPAVLRESLWDVTAHRIKKVGCGGLEKKRNLYNVNHGKTCEILHETEIAVKD